MTAGQEQDANPDAERGKNELGGCFHRESKCCFKRACAAAVAQVSNLLYRRLPVGSAPEKPITVEARGACELEIRGPTD